MAHQDRCTFPIYPSIVYVLNFLCQRFGNAITLTGTLNLRHATFANDFNVIEEGCSCTCCRREDQGGLGITRAYIYHVASKETVGAHL